MFDKDDIVIKLHMLKHLDMIIADSFNMTVEDYVESIERLTEWRATVIMHQALCGHSKYFDRCRKILMEQLEK